MLTSVGEQEPKCDKGQTAEGVVLARISVNWVAMEESLPPANMIVLIQTSERQITLGQWNDQYFVGPSGGILCPPEIVTHWMMVMTTENRPCHWQNFAAKEIP